MILSSIRKTPAVRYVFISAALVLFCSLPTVV